MGGKFSTDTKLKATLKALHYIFFFKDALMEYAFHFSSSAYTIQDHEY